MDKTLERQKGDGMHWWENKEIIINNFINRIKYLKMIKLMKKKIKESLKMIVQNCTAWHQEARGGKIRRENSWR